VSVGAVIADPDETAEHVLRRADAAMYQSKAMAAMRTETPVASPGWV
jgi:GGDEF domain-containing protein